MLSQKLRMCQSRILYHVAFGVFCHVALHLLQKFCDCNSPPAALSARRRRGQSHPGVLQALHFSEGGVAFNLPTQCKLSCLIPPLLSPQDRPVEHRRPKHGKNECTCAVRKYVEMDFSFDLSANRIPHFPHITLLHAVLCLTIRKSSRSSWQPWS